MRMYAFVNVCLQPDCKSHQCMTTCTTGRIIVFGLLCRAMVKNTFFLGALMLALIALITHSVARGFLEDALHRQAARIAQVQKQQIAYTPDLQAFQSSRTYNFLTVVGVVLTVMSMLCMVTAWVRHEKGWYLLLIFLLFLNFMVPMLL